MSPAADSTRPVTTYTRHGRRHRIELVVVGGQRRLVVDRPAAGGPVVLIAELDGDEGRAQIQAILRGEGDYLRRARDGEPDLGRVLYHAPAEQADGDQAAEAA